MKTGELVLCSLIVYISITVAVGRYFDNNEENYEQLKRILGEKHRGTMGQTGSSSEENSYGICAASNPCEHEGICISKGRRSYYCECTDNYYGKHCEKQFDFSKRNALNKYYDQIKRIVEKKSSNAKDKTDGRVYYDYLNGIYF